MVRDCVRKRGLGMDGVRELVHDRQERRFASKTIRYHHRASPKAR